MKSNVKEDKNKRTIISKLLHSIMVDIVCKKLYFYMVQIKWNISSIARTNFALGILFKRTKVPNDK